MEDEHQVFVISPTSRVTLNSKSINGSQVSQISKLLRDQYNLSHDVLVLCGKILHEEETFKTCDTCTLYAWSRHVSTTEKTERVDHSTAINVTKKLQDLLKRPQLFFKIKKLVSCRASFKSLMDSVPGISNDLYSIKVLKDVCLMSNIVTVENAKLLADEHPATIKGAQYILSTIKDTSPLPSFPFFSDLAAGDSEEETDTASEPQPNSEMYNRMLMDLLGQGQQTNNSNRAAASSSGPATSSPIITSTMLSEALSNVISSPPRAPTQAPSVAVDDDALQQLVELGIQEDRGRRALIATSNNLEEALELLFNENF